MRFLMRLVLRIVLYSLPILTYLLLYQYDNYFLNVLIFEMPKPTAFSRPAEVYGPSSFGAPIKAGFVKKDITPARFSWLGGYHPPHPGIFINDRIWVKSLALQDKNGNTIVIVSCGLIGFLPDEIGKIKALVKNIDSDAVFISTTHTHSGPDTLGLWGILPFSGKNKRYLRFLRKEIALAIDESVDDLRGAAVRFGLAKAKFSEYVRGRYENSADPGVSVMQVLLASGTPVTLVNYACHPDVIKNLYITADFPYFLEKRIKILTGGETMFIPGAIGGVEPHDNEFLHYFVKVLGENLADTVVFEALKNPIISKEAEINFRKLEIKAPLENSGLRKAVELGIVSNLLGEDDKITAEVALIKIGPAQFLTVPGELFPKIWWRVKPCLQGGPKFILGLTNGEFGYILLPEDFESKKHPYHVSMSVGPLFGKEIDKALQELIKSR